MIGVGWPGVAWPGVAWGGCQAGDDAEVGAVGRLGWRLAGAWAGRSWARKEGEKASMRVCFAACVILWTAAAGSLRPLMR